MEESELIKPSHANEPEVSLSVTSLPRPEAASAEVSPMVSVAETKKIRTTDKIASERNSILNGIKCGKAIKLVSDSAEKSTIPIGIAMIYPTIRPNKTDNCFQ